LIILTLVGVSIHHLLPLSGDISLTVLPVRHECGWLTRACLVVPVLPVHGKFSLSSSFGIDHALLSVVNAVALVSVEFRTRFVVSENWLKE